MGAGSRMDGHHCAIFPANGANTPVEILESDTPLIVEARELVCDSGGPGKMRGGLGRRMVIRVPDDEYAPLPPTTIAIQAGRFRYAPPMRLYIFSNFCHFLASRFSLGIYYLHNLAKALFLLDEKSSINSGAHLLPMAH